MAEDWLGLLAELLELALVLVLPAELLELLVGGGALVGGGVDCGCVGLLAVGHPVNKMHRQPAALMLQKRLGAVLL